MAVSIDGIRRIHGLLLRIAVNAIYGTRHPIEVVVLQKLACTEKLSGAHFARINSLLQRRMFSPCVSHPLLNGRLGVGRERGNVERLACADADLSKALHQL